MNSSGDQISLEGKSISTYFFDKNGHFCGFALIDNISGAEEKFVPNDLWTKAIKVDYKMLEGHQHTRLIGFRTGKRCHTDHLIKEIMPIYYSRNEEMCKQHLTPISQNYQGEIASYGLECNDASLKVGMGTHEETQLAGAV